MLDLLKQPMLVLLPLSSLLLTGCQSMQVDSSSDLHASSGYMCAAVSAKTAKKHFSAWAREQRTARAYALSRCQSQTKYPAKCHIKECLWTGAKTEVSQVRWYTCYANNKKRDGVWSATSHQRLTAMKLGFDRCVNYSGQPSACFVRYCRLW